MRAGFVLGALDRRCPAEVAGVTVFGRFGVAIGSRAPLPADALTIATGLLGIGDPGGDEAEGNTGDRGDRGEGTPLAGLSAPVSRNWKAVSRGGRSLFRLLRDPRPSGACPRRDRPPEMMGASS